MKVYIKYVGAHLLLGGKAKQKTLISEKIYVIMWHVWLSNPSQFCAKVFLFIIVDISGKIQCVPQTSMCVIEKWSHSSSEIIVCV